MGRQRRIRHARKVIRHDLEADKITLEQAHAFYQAAKAGEVLSPVPQYSQPRIDPPLQIMDDPRNYTIDASEWYCPNCQTEGMGLHQCRGVVTIDMGGRDE